MGPAFMANPVASLAYTEERSYPAMVTDPLCECREDCGGAAEDAFGKSGARLSLVFSLCHRENSDFPPDDCRPEDMVDGPLCLPAVLLPASSLLCPVYDCPWCRVMFPVCIVVLQNLLRLTREYCDRADSDAPRPCEGEQRRYVAGYGRYDY